jgi:hypothetical protein
MIDQALIEGITRIANHDKILKELEPQVMHHTKLTESDVKRVLYSLALLIKEWEKHD